MMFHNGSPSRPASLAMMALLVCSLPIRIVSFTTPQLSRPSLSTITPRSTASSIRPNADLAPLFASASANGDSNQTASDAILRSLEKKEAKMNQQRQAAVDKLNKVEQTLASIKSKKQEYLNGLTLDKAPEGGNFSETTVRSAVKALMWRVIAGSVTFFTSLRFSGSMKTALSIVGSDFFSKALTMFIGERLMNKSQAGRKTGKDGAGRSLAKALIWRLFAICNTLTMAIFIAKDISIASKIAGSDAIFKTALMFFYERVWARVEWGKEYTIEFSI